jgi:hypothetical protein
MWMYFLLDDLAILISTIIKELLEPISLVRMPLYAGIVTVFFDVLGNCRNFMQDWV